MLGYSTPDELFEDELDRIYIHHGRVAFGSTG